MYFCFSGDFFKDSIPEADLYILSKILHDWDDDKCGQLLAKVHKACRPGRCELLESRETPTSQLHGAHQLQWVIWVAGFECSGLLSELFAFLSQW